MAQPSGIGTLNWRDAGRSALLAGITAILTALYDALIAGVGFEFDWVHLKPMVVTGVIAMIGYLLKNVFTNNAGQLFQNDKEKILVTKDQVK